MWVSLLCLRSAAWIPVGGPGDPWGFDISLGICPGGSGSEAEYSGDSSLVLRVQVDCGSLLVAVASCK